MKSEYLDLVDFRSVAFLVETVIRTWLSLFIEVSTPIALFIPQASTHIALERWGAGVETQKNVRGEIGGWGRVPFNETYAPSLSTITTGRRFHEIS